VRFDLQAHAPLSPGQRAALDRAAARYGGYLRLDARLTVG
jgi:hypothetical protein